MTLLKGFARIGAIAVLAAVLLGAWLVVDSATTHAATLDASIQMEEMSVPATTMVVDLADPVPRMDVSVYPIGDVDSTSFDVLGGETQLGLAANDSAILALIEATTANDAQPVTLIPTNFVVLVALGIFAAVIVTVVALQVYILGAFSNVARLFIGSGGVATRRLLRHGSMAAFMMLALFVGSSTTAQAGSAGMATATGLSFSLVLVLVALALGAFSPAILAGGRVVTGRVR